MAVRVEAVPTPTKTPGFPPPIIEARRRRQDLRHREARGARPPRRDFLRSARRDGRDHGPERLRQDDAPQLPLRARRDRRRRRRDRRRLSQRDVRSPADGLPGSADGLHLPVLQPDAGAVGGGERRASIAGLRASASAKRGDEPSLRSSWSDWETAGTTFPTSSQVASDSASPSRVRSSTTRQSCGRMSRQAISTARTPRRSSSSCAGSTARRG